MFMYLFVDWNDAERNSSSCHSTRFQNREPPKGSVLKVYLVYYVPFPAAVVIPYHLVLKGNMTRNVAFLSTNKYSSII